MKPTRRDMMAAGSVGFLATAAAATSAQSKAKAPADTMTAAEKANIELVKGLLGEFGNPDIDLDAVMEKYIAPTGAVRWVDSLPAVIGPVAASIQAKALAVKGATVTVKYLEIFAKGPLVATSRIDTMNVPGKGKTDFSCAGVHVIKDGKLIEYTDYVLS